MKRKLHDALMQQVEAGLIVPDECGIIRSQYCFKSRWSDVEKLEASVAEKILAFHQLAEIFGLPTHNAVAFFTRAFEKQVPPEEMDAFRKLICLAIAGRGFLFGTTFDRERNSNLRPCDLPMKGWMESNHFPLNLGALRNQAALKSAAYFEQDYCMCEKDTVRRLEQQRAVFVEWKQLAEDLKLHKCTYPFKLEAKNILSFFHIYTRYSLMQLRNQEIVTATAQETKRVKNELKELRQVSLLLMQLHRFRQKADELLGLEEDAEFSKGKKEWINKFLTYINRKRTIDAAKIAEKIVDRDNELATNIAGELESIRNIAKAGLNETTRKKYPILDPNSMARKLNRTETKLLNAYREHPMYRCYAELKRYLETSPIAAIAPY